jgi:hypothetical protein
MATTTAAIDLELVQTDDVLMIRQDRNRISVKAVRSDDRITAVSFNSTIVIATKTRAGKWKLADRLHIDGHQPPMF